MIRLALIHLGKDAYGVPISRELERHRGHDVAIGSRYAALERMEAKWLVIRSTFSDPAPERGRFRTSPQIAIDQFRLIPR